MNIDRTKGKTNNVAICLTASVGAADLDAPVENYKVSGSFTLSIFFLRLS